MMSLMSLLVGSSIVLSSVISVRAGAEGFNALPFV